MSPTVYLVSGANRGIGLGLTKALVVRKDVVVFAGARQPDAAEELQALAKDHPGQLHVLKLTSADEVNNREAIDKIKKVVGRLDVVVANAGIAAWFGPASDVPLDVMREHLEVNTLGVLALFQAGYPLMRASTPTPKFVAISSGAGSIGLALDFPHAPYGTSKAALNYLLRKLRAENDGLVCFPVCPGSVATDMTAPVRKDMEKDLGGLASHFKEPNTVAVDILKRIDEATRETDVFLQYDGTTWPW